MRKDKIEKHIGIFSKLLLLFRDMIRWNQSPDGSSSHTRPVTDGASFLRATSLPADVTVHSLASCVHVILERPSLISRPVSRGLCASKVPRTHSVSKLPGDSPHQPKCSALLCLGAQAGHLPPSSPCPPPSTCHQALLVSPANA